MAATVGQIYGTAPTHVATDNFAERLDRISKSVTARRNKDKKSGDSTRARRALVIRGYKPAEEFGAFTALLRDPQVGNNAAANRKWSPEANWKLNLSPSYWLLIALRSPAVRGIHEDDPQVVFDVQATIDKSEEYRRLRAVATGAMTWEEYSPDRASRNTVMGLVQDLVNGADILCTTPSMSCKTVFEDWKNKKARGIAVDEAGNISRPDLYRVWGNTLLPCLLGGDDLQLPPTVMTKDEKDEEGNHRNRLGADGTMSALEFFRSSGWPIYRLRTQLRMAKGLFNTCHREVYNDVPFNYGTGSDLGNHATGVNLENYLRAKFPKLARTAAGTLSEVFVHCQGTKCLVDEVTHSKRNPDQVLNALDFLADMVKTARISPADIAIITPYAANVELVNRRRMRPEYEVLSAMPPAATVDSFQGREADIMVVIMGTTEEVGPGFTTDPHRLNVMLSRQRSGLLVFGDIMVAGDLMAAAGTRPNGRKLVRAGDGSQAHKVKEGMLHKVLRGWQTSGRVVTLPPRSNAKAGPSKPAPPMRLEKYIAPL